MRIKNRKIALHQVAVSLGGRTAGSILVTPAQLTKLNRVPVGKELFLSRYYCHTGGEFSVIRTRNGLQYLPNAFRVDPSDDHLLEALLK